MLMATHEVLLKKAVTQFESEGHTTLSTSHSTAFWQWLEHLESPTNKDQNSRFWACILLSFNHYVGSYVAVRSGNLCMHVMHALRLLPLFFAYSRDKYEHLCTNVIKSLH